MPWIATVMREYDDRQNLEGKVKFERNLSFLGVHDIVLQAPMLIACQIPAKY